MPDPTHALAETFSAHLENVARRAALALEEDGYGSALWFSGGQPDWFEDDQGPPFGVNAPFKTWAPLIDVPNSFVYFEPGREPRLLLHQPPDYWYKPAETPAGYWTSHFERAPCRDRDAARALLPADLSRTAFIGEPFAELATWGVAAVNPRQLLTRLDYARAVKTPYELECLRQANRLGVRGHLAAAHAFARATANSRSSSPFCEPAASVSTSCRTTPSSRSTKAPRCCITRCSTVPRPASGIRC